MELETWVEEAVENTALTQRQAVAYFFREEGFDRSQTAAMMNTSDSNVDNLYRVAKQKIEEAHALVDLIEDF